MTRDELLFSICPGYRAPECFKGDKSCNCNDCNRVLGKWLYDYEKHVIEQYKASTNLKDTIRDIHDNVAREMYCKGIDDFTERLKACCFMSRPNIRTIELIAKEVKEQNR